jgi:hypothetical protein
MLYKLHFVAVLEFSESVLPLYPANEQHFVEQIHQDFDKSE